MYYNYILNVTAANKKMELSEEIVEAIKIACTNANESTNSIRYGRKFTFLSRIDAYTIQIELTSKSEIIASRCISSITKALLRTTDPVLLKSLQYNTSILHATVVNENIFDSTSYNNLQPHEIVQSVIEIFFGQTKLRNTDKKSAKEAADNIKKIVIDYKLKTHI